MGVHANQDHFEIAFEHSLKSKFTDKQACCMANGMKKRGLVDAAEGYSHYALCYINARLNQGPK